MNLPVLPGASAAPGFVVGATTVQAIGTVIAALVVVGFVVYVVVNVLQGRPEAGSEIELAPNRKPYYDDDELETTKLNRTLTVGVLLLAVVAVGLPLYWLNEPGRMSGAAENDLRTFEARGLEQYEEGSQCVNCHAAEGVGGQAPYTLLDADGQFVAQVNWMAPALNTVLLRYSREEVIDIVDLGRDGTPMPAWGAGGGGPRSEQEIENIVDYLASIQLTPEEAQRESQQELAVELGLLSDDETEEAAIDRAIEQIPYDAQTGEALFNLGQQGTFAGGAYACGRCHTQGWSIITEGEDVVQPAGADIGPYVDYEPGSGGGLAYALDNLVPRKFATVDELAEFISLGTIDGEGYGRGGQGSGRMPGFGDNPNTESVEGDGMMTREMICAIALYETTLHGGAPPDPQPTTTTTAPTTTTTAVEGEAAEEEPAAPEESFCAPSEEGTEEE